MLDKNRESLGSRRGLASKLVQNWPIFDTNEQKELTRDKVLKTLGNLTLVTKRLNSKLSNDAWEEKKKTLLKYSSLNITIDHLDGNWDEVRIASRASDLADLAVKMWAQL